MVTREFASTLDLALKLHPGTRRIVFVAGTSEFDRRLIDEAQTQLRPYERRFEFSYLTGLPMQRARHGPCDQPIHHQSPWWPDMGGE